MKKLSSIRLIDNGKKPDEPYNARLGFWLPADSPYGNFQLKYMTIITRVDRINRHIEDSWQSWKKCRVDGILPTGALDWHVFNNEELVYMLRRVADELISLIYCLSEYKQNGQYPKKIKIDCLGAVIEQNKSGPHKVHKIFVVHIEIMTILNDVSNTFKHSFINSDQYATLGYDEPTIFALGLHRNKLEAQPLFYRITLSSLVEKYDIFFRDCRDWLEKYSKNNRRQKESKKE